MTSETKARSALIALHHQICFENGDHPDEVDTVYSTGADAITRADLSDAKDARIAELAAEIVRMKSERMYVIGFNDGYDKAENLATLAELKDQPNDQ